MKLLVPQREKETTLFKNIKTKQESWLQPSKIPVEPEKVQFDAILRKQE